MKLVPYRNIFEVDIPNIDEYDKFQEEQRTLFRDELIEEPDFLVNSPNDYGAQNMIRGPLFSYYRDVVGTFNGSRYEGYPRFKTSRDVSPDEAIETELENNFLSGWEKFHHIRNRHKYDASILEAQKNGWEKDENNVVSSLYNSIGFIGFYSNRKYEDYAINVNMSSSANDNDRLIYIIKYVKEPSGKEYTLSAIRNNDNDKFTWRIVYNYMQEDEWVVEDKSFVIQRGGNWSQYPVGTNIDVTVQNNIITAKTSQNNSTELVEHSSIVIDLNLDKRLFIFKDICKIGFGCHSQAKSTFQNINFIEYGDSFPDYLGRNITMLFRGDNYSGRHVLPKYMTRLDPNKLLLIDNDSDYLDIIATVCPMFRTIIVGYHIPGITNGGTDLIKRVNEFQDVKNILDIIYSIKEFDKYNIIIEGDIIQPYINHMYIHHLNLNNKYSSQREWFDVYTLSQEHIDRMNERVTEEHFKMWGYAKHPYQPKNYPWHTDNILHETSKKKDTEILSHSLGDQPLSKYPDTISIPRKRGFRMLIEFIMGSGTRVIKHYKTKKPKPCKYKVDPTKSEPEKNNFVEGPKTEIEWDKEDI